jgi:hypothetical protein
MTLKIITLVIWIMLGLFNLLSEKPITKVDYFFIWVVAILNILNGIILSAA